MTISTIISLIEAPVLREETKRWLYIIPTKWHKCEKCALKARGATISEGASNRDIMVDWRILKKNWTQKEWFNTIKRKLKTLSQHRGQVAIYKAINRKPIEFYNIFISFRWLYTFTSDNNRVISKSNINDTWFMRNIPLVITYHYLKKIKWIGLYIQMIRCRICSPFLFRWLRSWQATMVLLLV